MSLLFIFLMFFSVTPSFCSFCDVFSVLFSFCSFSVSVFFYSVTLAFGILLLFLFVLSVTLCSVTVL